MNVEELIVELLKHDKSAEVVIATDYTQQGYYVEFDVEKDGNLVVVGVG